MGLIHEIQSDLLNEGMKIGSILLKLRLLASKIENEQLEDWVKYESDGYPHDVELPDYRRVGVHHTATFFGPFNSGVKNQPITPFMIKEHAGDQWNHQDFRASMAEVDEIANTNNKTIQIDRSLLIHVLQGNILPNYSCNSVIGHISAAAIKGIQNAVRTRIFELSISMEKSLPEIIDINIGTKEIDMTSKKSDELNQITHQVVYGNMTSIINSGKNANIQIGVKHNDLGSLIEHLINNGIEPSDAQQFGDILSSETPISNQEPLGKKAQEWFASNIKKAVDGSWKVGASIATKVLTEAALKYYGLE